MIKATLIGLFFGTFGTTLGGIIGITFKNNSNKFLSFILEFASGLMMSIICFELIPEALLVTNVPITIIGILCGIIMMIVCENKVKIKYNKKTGDLLKTGIIIGIGLAIHNFPEGLAIGTGFENSIKLGYSLAVAILLHDIPEGISMAVPMKMGGLSRKKVLFYTILSGMTTGLGAFLGSAIGGISDKMIGICLAFAAGCMVYIVARRATTRI